MGRVKLMMTVLVGNYEVTVPVHDDKRPDGLRRMESEAIEKALIVCKSQGMSIRGLTIRIKSNWNKGV